MAGFQKAKVSGPWTASAYQPYQFNHTADFGEPKSVENQYTGQSVPTFSKIATLHYCKRNQSMLARYQAAGTDYENSLTIVIRHNKDLASRKVLFVKIDDLLYKCLSYSADDSSYNAVDLLTLKHVEKVS